MSRIGPRGATAVTLVSDLSLNDLLWVANTGHGPAGHWHARVRGEQADHDHLADPAAARAYLADHGVRVPPDPPDPGSLASLRLVRTVIQRLIVPGADPWAPGTTELLDASRFRLDEQGRIVADGAGWPAFVANLVPGLVALVGQRNRLGQCGNPDCRLTFLDDTRNHGRRWCDPMGCGNRARVGRARGRTPWPVPGGETRARPPGPSGVQPPR
jgi:predicted RNA-binding Zn ribbon-like protein